MDVGNVIVGILSALGGGALASYLTFRISLKRQKLSEFEVLIQEYKSMKMNLDQRVQILEEKLEQDKARLDLQRGEIQELRYKLQIFESSHADIPLPMWLKDTDGTMLFLNKQYEDTFLIPRGYEANDYVGHKDDAVWGDEIAVAFQLNDRKVIRSKKPVRTIEPLIDEEGDTYYCEILKYPRSASGRVIGISGIVLKTAKTKEELK